MFVDALLLVSDAQAVTVDAVSTNTIDVGNHTVIDRIGTGEPLAFGVQVDVAADHTTGDETYEIQIIESDNADLSSATVIAAFLIDYTLLTAGKKHALPLPPGRPTKRYLGLNYNTGGTTPSVTLTAFLSPLSMIDPSYTVYPSGFSV